jgi:hypothetical protein
MHMPNEHVAGAAGSSGDGGEPQWMHWVLVRPYVKVEERGRHVQDACGHHVYKLQATSQLFPLSYIHSHAHMHHRCAHSGSNMCGAGAGGTIRRHVVHGANTQYLRRTFHIAGQLEKSI